MGAVVTVALVSLLPTFPTSLLAVVWGLILFPATVLYIRSHARARRRDDTTEESDAFYWRIRLR